MTFAQAANKETCAGCSQPAVAYGRVLTPNGVATIGWCLACVDRRWGPEVESEAKQ